MDLRSLNPKILWRDTAQLIQHERELTLEILQYLAEIQRRRLYAEHKFSSLRDMLVRGFKYSSGSAGRRLDSVRLLAMHPHLEAKLLDGSFNITNMQAAYHCFNDNSFTQEQQVEILAHLENKSTKEVARELAKHAPRPLPADKEVALDAEHTLYTIVVDKETHEMFVQLKAMMSHRNPAMKKGEMLKILARLGIAKYDKAREPSRKRAKTPAPEFGDLSAERRREVYQRDQSKCVVCGTDHQVEIDHIIPRARGGSKRT